VPVDVRPLLPADVAAADDSAYRSLSEMAALYEGSPMPERSPERVARGRHRVAHLQRTDPGGAWVAVDGEELVGVALALRRGPLWFLSLLTVATGHQSRGIGARLLEASLRTAADAPAGLIVASSDPKALRRYALAGFALHPAYVGTGRTDRAGLPSGLGVRDGDWATDADLVEDVVTRLRGVGYGPDLTAMAVHYGQLMVAEDGPERGFCLRGTQGVQGLGATTPALAQRLLWEGLARGDGEEYLEPLGADQPWAVEVALAARLSLSVPASTCRRGVLGPLTPFLPSGAYG